jgi:hypothetical protein
VPRPPLQRSRDQRGRLQRRCPAINQDIADTGCAQFAEGDFLRVRCHRCLPKKDIRKRAVDNQQGREAWFGTPLTQRFGGSADYRAISTSCCKLRVPFQGDCRATFAVDVPLSQRADKSAPRRLSCFFNGEPCHAQSTTGQLLGITPYRRRHCRHCSSAADRHRLGGGIEILTIAMRPELVDNQINLARRMD